MQVPDNVGNATAAAATNPAVVNPPAIKAPIAYALTSKQDWDAAIDALPWELSAPRSRIWVKPFECPQCHDAIQLTYRLDLHPGFMSMFSARDIPAAEVFTGDGRLKRKCECEGTHGAPAGAKGCGAEFLITPPTETRALIGRLITPRRAE